MVHCTLSEWRGCHYNCLKWKPFLMDVEAIRITCEETLFISCQLKGSLYRLWLAWLPLELLARKKERQLRVAREVHILFMISLSWYMHYQLSGQEINWHTESFFTWRVDWGTCIHCYLDKLIHNISDCSYHAIHVTRSDYYAQKNILLWQPLWTTPVCNQCYTSYVLLGYVDTHAVYISAHTQTFGQWPPMNGAVHTVVSIHTYPITNRILSNINSRVGKLKLEFVDRVVLITAIVI